MPKVEKNKKNLDACKCIACPSYNDCAKKKKERLYCAKSIGKSSCKFAMNGCVCGMCSVHKENGLKSLYYCMQSSEE